MAPLLLTLVLCTVPLQGSMHDLGALGGPSASSNAVAVSHNGEVIVGDARDALGHRRAFRWTPAQGMVDLGDFGGPESRAYGVSDDGLVVVGEASRASGAPHAFVWSAATGLQGLGTPALARSVAYDCSADGSVVVGEIGFGYGVRRRAFAWTQTGGIRDLGTLGGAWSGARGISADGNVVVGASETAAGEIHAFSWSSATGMVDLGALAQGAESSAARANADGSVIVGLGSEAVPIYHPLRWVNGALQDLGTLGSSVTTASDVSADGAAVVGGGLVPAFGHQGRAFLWTPGTGFILLGTLGGNESWANGVSADGTTVVGGSIDGQGVYRAFRWRSAAASVSCQQSLAGSCTPSYSAEGAPSASNTGSFWLRAHSLPERSFATLSYGVGAAVAVPLGNGLLCVPGAPTRLAVLPTGGSGACTGSLQFDFNAAIATVSDPRLVAGAHIVVQLLYRDAGALSSALFSAAYEFDLGP